MSPFTFPEACEPANGARGWSAAVVDVVSVVPRFSKIDFGRATEALADSAGRSGGYESITIMSLYDTSVERSCHDVIDVSRVIGDRRVRENRVCTSQLVGSDRPGTSRLKLRGPLRKPSCRPLSRVPL